MTSPSPLLYDTYYHIYNRGVNSENIFIEERNYEHFLNLYEKHLEPICDLFAYCMLRNHFHITVRVKSEEEILEYKQTLKVSETFRVLEKEKPIGSESLRSVYVSNQFSNFLNAYAKAINKAYRRTGSLFQHPFGRVPIGSDRQFWNVIAYIQQNPQKHKFVEDFRDWKYSSYGIILSEKRTSVNRDEVLKWFGSKERYLDLHKDWVTDAQSKWFAEDDYD
jgi:putative transposase